jgi:hypothetical protein
MRGRTAVSTVTVPTATDNRVRERGRVSTVDDRPPELSIFPPSALRSSPGHGRFLRRSGPNRHLRAAYRARPHLDGGRPDSRPRWCDRWIRPVRQWRGREAQRGGGSHSQDPRTRCTGPPGIFDRRRSGCVRVHRRTSPDRKVRGRAVRLRTRHSSCHNAIRSTGQFGGSSARDRQRLSARPQRYGRRRYQIRRSCAPSRRSCSCSCRSAGVTRGVSGGRCLRTSSKGTFLIVGSG